MLVQRVVNNGHHQESIQVIQQLIDMENRVWHGESFDYKMQRSGRQDRRSNETRSLSDAIGQYVGSAWAGLKAKPKKNNLPSKKAPSSSKHQTTAAAAPTSPSESSWPNGGTGSSSSSSSTALVETQVKWDPGAMVGGVLDSRPSLLSPTPTPTSSRGGGGGAGAGKIDRKSKVMMEQMLPLSERRFTSLSPSAKRDRKTQTSIMRDMNEMMVGPFWRADASSTGRRAPFLLQAPASYYVLDASGRLAGLRLWALPSRIIERMLLSRTSTTRQRRRNVYCGWKLLPRRRCWWRYGVLPLPSSSSSPPPSSSWLRRYLEATANGADDDDGPSTLMRFESDRDMLSIWSPIGQSPIDQPSHRRHFSIYRELSLRLTKLETLRNLVQRGVVALRSPSGGGDDDDDDERDLDRQAELERQICIWQDTMIVTTLYMDDRNRYSDEELLSKPDPHIWAVAHRPVPSDADHFEDGGTRRSNDSQSSPNAYSIFYDTWAGEPSQDRSVRHRTRLYPWDVYRPGLHVPLTWRCLPDLSCLFIRLPLWSEDGDRSCHFQRDSDLQVLRNILTKGIFHPSKVRDTDEAILKALGANTRKRSRCGGGGGARRSTRRGSSSSSSAPSGTRTHTTHTLERIAKFLMRLVACSLLGYYPHCRVIPSFEARRLIYTWLVYRQTSIETFRQWIAGHKHLLIYLLREHHLFQMSQISGTYQVFHELYDYRSIERNVRSTMDMVRRHFSEYVRTRPQLHAYRRRPGQILRGAALDRLMTDVFDDQSLDEAIRKRYQECLQYCYRPRKVTFVREICQSCRNVDRTISNVLMDYDPRCQASQNLLKTKMKAACAMFRTNMPTTNRICQAYTQALCEFNYYKNDLRAVLRGVIERQPSGHRIGLEWLCQAFDVHVRHVEALNRARLNFLKETSHREPQNAIVSIVISDPRAYFILREFYTLLRRRHSIVCYTLDYDLHNQQRDALQRKMNLVVRGRPLSDHASIYYFCSVHRTIKATLVGTEHGESGYKNTKSIGHEGIAIDPIDWTRYCTIASQRIDRKHVNDPLFECLKTPLSRVNLLGRMLKLGHELYLLCPHCACVMTYRVERLCEIGIWCGSCTEGQRAMADYLGLEWIDRRSTVKTSESVGKSGVNNGHVSMVVRPRLIGGLLPAPHLKDGCAFCSVTRVHSTESMRHVLVWDDCRLDGRAEWRYIPVCDDHTRYWFGQEPRVLCLSRMANLIAHRVRSIDPRRRQQHQQIRQLSQSSSSSAIRSRDPDHHRRRRRRHRNRDRDDWRRWALFRRDRESIIDQRCRRYFIEPSKTLKNSEKNWYFKSMRNYSGDAPVAPAPPAPSPLADTVESQSPASVAAAATVPSPPPVSTRRSRKGRSRRRRRPPKTAPTRPPVKSEKATVPIADWRRQRTESQKVPGSHTWGVMIKLKRAQRRNARSRTKNLRR